jgi:hypothetical protein
MIKTVKFKFKRINQEATPHYRQPVPVTDGSVDGITRTVAPGMALTRALPSAPALSSTLTGAGGSIPGALVLASSGRALPRPPLSHGTSLTPPAT